MARERKTKHAQWLRLPHSFETGALPPASTPLIPLRRNKNLVAHAIKPENWERFMRAQRAAKRSHRGGLIPDLVILRFFLPSSDGLLVARTYDVKTVGYSEKHYRASIPRGREADTRAAEVPADYETGASEGGRRVQRLAVPAWRPAGSCAHPPALSSTSHRPQRWVRRRVLARSLAVHLGSCRGGCSGARALRVLPRLGSGARRDRELRAARFWPNLIARRCEDPAGCPYGYLCGATRAGSFAGVFLIEADIKYRLCSSNDIGPAPRFYCFVRCRSQTDVHGTGRGSYGRSAAL